MYGMGGIANQAVAVLLVPIYARVLGPSGVGVTAVINSTLSLSLIVAGLALPQAFLRWYLKEAENDRDRARVLGTTMAVRLAASLAGMVAVALAVIPLTLALYGDAATLPIFLLIAPIILFDSVLAIPLTVLRAQRRPRPYAFLSFTRAVLGSVLIVALVVVAGVGVIGVVIGSAVAAGVSAGVGLFVLSNAGLLRFAWDGRLARSMLAFSLPLVPAGLAGWALNLSDRYLLQAFTDAATVGIYAMGYTAGLVVNALAVQPFAVAWGATYWEIARRGDAAAAIARVLTAYAAAGALAALLLSALGTDLLRVLVGERFEASRFVVPFSAFAFVLYGVFLIGTTGINLASRTGLFPLIMAGAAALGVVLNVLLIPTIGFMGAAVSTLAAYTVLALSGGLVAQRMYPVPWDLPRVAGLLLTGGALSAAALLGPDHAAWRVGCLLAYLPLVLIFRLVSPGELAAAWRSVPPSAAR